MSLIYGYVPTQKDVEVQFPKPNLKQGNTPLGKG